jgi:hypothetical protein
VRDATYFVPSKANVQLVSAHSCPNALASHETSAPSSPTARTCVACAAVAALCVNAASRTCVLSAGPPGAVISAAGFAVSTGAVPGGPSLGPTHRPASSHCVPVAHASVGPAGGTMHSNAHVCSTVSQCDPHGQSASIAQSIAGPRSAGSLRVH